MERIAYEDLFLEINSFNATFMPNVSEFACVDQFS